MLLPVILAAAGLGGGVAADDPDLHCAALFALVAGVSEDEAKKKDVVAGFLYYVGKIDGRSPGYDLENGLGDLLTQPGYMIDILPKDAERCGEELKQRGADLERLGEALKARGKS